MNKTQKELLARLMTVTNSLGGTLDGTATCEQKYIDRQHALIQGHIWFIWR